MKASDVFTPGRFPSVTFVKDHIEDKQVRLKDILEAGATVVSLSGPSKSGKTVFVENTVGRDNLVHVTGSGVDSPDKLWMRVFNFLETPLAQSAATGINLSGTLSGKAGGETNWLVAKGKAEVSGSASLAVTKSETNGYSIDCLQVLIKELSGTGLVLFIDDFHYMPRQVQEDVSRQIKEAIRNDVKIVCASVPYHSDDVLRANPDLSGRIEQIDFDFWREDFLVKIAEKGFSKLYIAYDSDFMLRLAREAAGSPQLMQTICLNACFESGQREAAEACFRLPNTDDFFRKVCIRTCSSVLFNSAYEAMKEGPKTRGNQRTAYILKDGTTCDVYPIILRAMANDPPKLTIRYSDLQERIGNLCSGDTPSGSSVTGACDHMARLANAAARNCIIEWDSESDVLDIRDPHFLFFLRWSEYVER
ncbi:hypothetical protein [Fundidesulfovibrio terrae]|uniref:hypothetical protein n=1 Tax=Fundidesulfovibrio terrae TaxID=2922866 RepID=UPI001FAF1BC4|nr:hypothetical protein [Fundidesulfovibrio terrae]